MTISELPEDLVEEILCHVPATNLKRLRSTCKRWDSLFNNMRFSTKHSDKAPKEFHVLMLTNKFRICPIIYNLHGIFSSVEVKTELSLLDPNSNNSCQFDIFRVFHCDGLLLCMSGDESRLVVWNPCTGQIKWITISRKKANNFVLGYYQDNNSSCKKSYKILRFFYDTKSDWEIYEFNSDSWRILNHDIAPRGYTRNLSIWVSLKGNTYWLASHVTQNPLGIFLLKFDFSTEKSELVPLPYQCPNYQVLLLSVVKEEKLSVFLQREKTSKAEIWMTNKIGETKAMSWSKVLALDWIWSTNYFQTYRGKFLFDEEKNFVVFCDRWIHDNNKIVVYIVGEDNKATPVDLVATRDFCWLAILNYSPSLAQISNKLKAKGD